MSETDSNLHRRKSDDSLGAYIKDRVLPPLIVAFILSSISGGWIMYRKLDDLSSQITQQYTAVEGNALEVRVTRAEAELIVIRSQMVGWDVLKRLEGQMSLLAATGQSDKGTKAIALTLRQELDARKEK